MYILLVCILLPLVQNGLSFSAEETDLKSLSSYEISDINANFDIWGTESEENDAGSVDFDTISQTLLEKICKDSNSLVYVIEEDITIDCKALKNNQPVEVKIIKREVDEVEGSGDDDTVTTTLQAVEENEEETNDVNLESRLKPETETELSVKAATNKDEETNQEEKKEPEGSSTVSISIGLEEKEPEVKPEQKSEEPEVRLEEKPEVKSEEPEVKPEEKSEEPEVNAEGKSEEPEEKSEEPEVKPEGKSAEPEIKPEEKSEEPEVKSEKKPEEKSEDAEANRIPNPEETPKETEETGFSPKSDPKKDAEIIDGRSLIPLEKEESKEAPGKDTDVKTVESTEDTKKAGTKDTTILVFLFVAVLVVGAMAFGYNFIKKRRQRSADLERVERGSIKRSLQNLTRPENEPEKKPLMDENNKEVEMVDLKKLDNTHEGPSETTVKS